MLRLAFGRPWRQTEGTLGSLMRLLGLDLPVPDHTTFSRRSAVLTVATALAKVEGLVSVVIDSTGLKVFGKGEWHLKKHGGAARWTWRKLHLGVDLETGGILASALITTDEDDASLVGPLLDQITRLLATILVDGAYDGEPIYRTVAGHSPDAAVIIPPRASAMPSDTADSARTQRDQHIQLINDRGRLGWQRAVQLRTPLLGRGGDAEIQAGDRPQPARLGPCPGRWCLKRKAGPPERSPIAGAGGPAVREQAVTAFFGSVEVA